MLKLDEENKGFINSIGNTSRLKILLALWKSDQELRIYKVSRFTGLKRSSVRRHLENLVENRLVTRKVYGEIVLYSINKDSPRLNALVNFFKDAKL